MASGGSRNPNWGEIEAQVGCFSAPPVYMSYQSPYQHTGFGVNQDSDNQFAQSSCIDFRGTEWGYPYAASQVAANYGSATQPKAPGPYTSEMFQYMPPTYRYAGEVMGSGYGPLGLALENARSGARNDDGMHRPVNMIVGLEPQGAAMRAGARVGDVLIEVNRMPVQRESAPLMKLVSNSYQTGTPVVFTVLRGNDVEHVYLIPPPHMNRPKSIPGYMAGPNPPEPFPAILHGWYSQPPGHGQNPDKTAVPSIMGSDQAQQ